MICTAYCDACRSFSRASNALSIDHQHDTDHHVPQYFAIKRPGGLGKADPECIVEGKEKESRVEESGIGNEEEVDSERVVPV